MRLAWLVSFAAMACGSVDDTPPPGCPLGQLECGGVCIEPLNDPANCGSCGNACAGAQVCGNGACATSCPAPQEACGGSCVDLDLDAAHCGACDQACAADEECRDGGCVRPCADGLLGTVKSDDYGMAWDGFARDAATLGAATSACEAFGARLPTATEVYRVRAAATTDVTDGSDTALLWTQVPADTVNQIVSRLDTGAATEVAAEVATPFRCVCAPPPPPAFTDARCHGPADAPCAVVGAHHVDALDRPALRHSAALWECQHELAHVASPLTLVAASNSGVTGSNAYLQTSDRNRSDRVTTLRWNGQAAWRGVYGTGTGDDLYFLDINANAAAPFRCAGPRTPVGVHPNAIAGARVAEITGLTLDGADRAIPASWAAAHDLCNAAGGHLATSAELAEGLYQGLGGGSGVEVWTGDSTGYADPNFRVATVTWSGLATRFGYVQADSGIGVDSGFKHTQQAPFRCVYYPIDAAYVAPTNCVGGCFEKVLGGATPARLWFDGADRPAANLATAAADCVDEGAHLATERDLVAAIRGGLPGGSSPAFVWAAELAQDQAIVARWTGTQLDWTDLYTGSGTQMTWDPPNSLRAYRCAWTNEVR